MSQQGLAMVGLYPAKACRATELLGASKWFKMKHKMDDNLMNI